MNVRFHDLDRDYIFKANLKNVRESFPSCSSHIGTCWVGGGVGSRTGSGSGSGAFGFANCA